MSIKINKPKTTTCNNCGFVIKNPHEVFSPDKINIEDKK